MALSVSCARRIASSKFQPLTRKAISVGFCARITPAPKPESDDLAHPQDWTGLSSVGEQVARPHKYRPYKQELPCVLRGEDGAFFGVLRHIRANGFNVYTNSGCYYGCIPIVLPTGNQF